MQVLTVTMRGGSRRFSLSGDLPSEITKNPASIHSHSIAVTWLANVYAMSCGTHESISAVGSIARLGASSARILETTYSLLGPAAVVPRRFGSLGFAQGTSLKHNVVTR